MFPNEAGRIFRYSGMFIFVILFISCSKSDYELLDPSGAGLWTYYRTGLPGTQVKDIACDSKGLIWAVFPGVGLANYNGSAWTSVNTSNSAIISNNVTCLATDIYGSLLIGTSNGISIRSENNQWSSYQDPLRTMYINAVRSTSKGWIIAGTEGQGFYVNKGNGYVRYYAAQYASVNAIEEDKTGIIWLGTDNGLARWDGSAFSYITTANGLPYNEVSSLFYDSGSRLWIGTSGGITVSWLDSGNRLNQLSLMNGTLGTFVSDIFQDRRGEVWFATWFDGLYRYDGVVPHAYKKYNGFPENDVNAIASDRKGDLWFGLYSKGMAKYTLSLE